MTLENSIADFLEALGRADDPATSGTPVRVAEFWRERLVSGYDADLEAVLADRIPESSGAVVTLSGIPFHGVCPHHLVPYFGEVHLAYDPAGEIVGLGALERLVAACSRRLVLQEPLTQRLVDALMSTLGARGAACAVEATHLCLVLRGREPRSARLHTRTAAGTLVGRHDILPPVSR
jgi:GTP cyclohydrolase IA